ncbi:MAG: TspO/MBR family protein [Methanoregula sp.]|nr:TspO/MBR family protein [Methanoregula sp.]
MATLRSVVLAATCILGPLVAGAVVGVLTSASMLSWFPVLNKPWFTPPAWVFGPVWTVLYLLMGIALYLVISQGWNDNAVKTGVYLFGLQLVLNLAWSFLFFGFRSPIAGLVCVILLLAAVIATIVAFHRVSKTAAVLLIPYLAWLCIATALNGAILLLN